MSDNLKKAIVAGISTLEKSEATTFKTLALLSREALLYVPDSKDIGIINRLLNVLTPKNREIAALFFVEFLPWKYDTKTKEFGGMIKSQAGIKTKLDNRTAFLKNEANNIWTWADKNVEPAKRKVNFFSRISNSIEQALNEENEGHLEVKQVFNAVMSGGLHLDDIMALAIEAVEIRKAEAEELAKRQAEMANATEGTATEPVEPAALPPPVEPKTEDVKTEAKPANNNRRQAPKRKQG